MNISFAVVFLVKVSCVLKCDPISPPIPSWYILFKYTTDQYLPGGAILATYGFQGMVTRESPDLQVMHDRTSPAKTNFVTKCTTVIERGNLKAWKNVNWHFQRNCPPYSWNNLIDKRCQTFSSYKLMAKGKAYLSHHWLQTNTLDFNRIAILLSIWVQ